MSYVLYILWCIAAVVVAISCGFALVAACKVIWVTFLFVLEMSQ